MKAVILAAGLGNRLRPLTNNKPKVMLSIGGKPLLWHHIKHLKKHGIEEIWINLHWLPEVVENYFGDGSKFGVKINYSYEKELLGTSGGLKNPQSNIEKELKTSQFLVVYGDNLLNTNYKKLTQFHNQQKSLITMGLYKSNEPWTMGVVETDSDGRVLKMVEKPPKEKVTTNQVNAGVYICQPEIYQYIPCGFSDFGFNIFPELLKKGIKIWALDTNSYVQDIGTLERLKKARKDYKSVRF